jgi:hypothetical protein
VTGSSRRTRRHDTPVMCDRALASRASGGDSLAFAVLLLLARHGDLIRAAGARYFLTGHARADVEQEAALGLYRACTDFRPERGVPFSRFRGSVRPPRGADRADGRRSSQAWPAQRAYCPGYAGDARIRHAAGNRSRRSACRARALGSRRGARATPSAPGAARPIGRARACRACARSRRRHAGRRRSRPGRQPRQLADHALTRARRKARKLLALDDAA